MLFKLSIKDMKIIQETSEEKLLMNSRQIAAIKT